MNNQNASKQTRIFAARSGGPGQLLSSIACTKVPSRHNSALF